MESNLGISKTKRNPDSYRQSGFVTSPKAEVILQIIKQYDGKKTKKYIYNKIKKEDPNVPAYPQFTIFMRKLNLTRERRVGSLLNDLSESLVTAEGEDKDKVMRNVIDTMFSKLFVMGDTVINQEMQEMKIQMDEGKPLSDGQKNRIMSWVFKGADLSIRQRTVDLKVQDGDREQGLIDNLLSAMQYGKADQRTIIDGEVEEIQSGQIHE